MYTVTMAPKDDMDRFPLTITCQVGAIFGDFAILVCFSKMVEKLVSPLKTEGVVKSHSFSIITLLKMMQLLTTKETTMVSMEKKEERRDIIQLLWTLGCPVITI